MRSILGLRTIQLLARLGPTLFLSSFPYTKQHTYVLFVQQICYQVSGHGAYGCVQYHDRLERFSDYREWKVNCQSHRNNHRGSLDESSQRHILESDTWHASILHQWYRLSMWVSKWSISSWNRRELREIKLLDGRHWIQHRYLQVNYIAVITNIQLGLLWRPCEVSQYRGGPDDNRQECYLFTFFFVNWIFVTQHDTLVVSKRSDCYATWITTWLSVLTEGMNFCFRTWASTTY